MATSFAWAVLYPEGRGFGCPGAPVIDSIAGTRQGAMANFIAAWRTGDHDGLTVSKVWQRAYARGWRLVRVGIAPAFNTSFVSEELR